MYFSTPWKTYHVSEMDRYETGGGPQDPVIYVAHDRTCVFVGARGGAAEAHRAGPEEISRLWDEHGIVALLAVCKVTRLHPAHDDPGRPQQH